MIENDCWQSKHGLVLVRAPKIFNGKPDKRYNLIFV